MDQPSSTPQTSLEPGREPTLGARDAEELAAYRERDARLRAKITGWKPITIWYAFWTAVFALAAVVGLGNGEVGPFLGGGVIAALLALYVRYLYNGGTRRVWFVVF